jgi:thiol-disulfide isomerase/thioredoxin
MWIFFCNFAVLFKNKPKTIKHKIMKNIKTKFSMLAVCILAVLTTSCSGGLERNEFRLKGFVEGVTENHLITYSYRHQGVGVTDTIPHENGHFDVVRTLESTDPVSVRLTIRELETPGRAMSTMPPAVQFFVSPRATITLQGALENLSLAKVTGGMLNDDLATYNALLFDAQTRMNELQPTIAQARRDGNTEVVEALFAKAREIRTELEDIRVQFIANNPNMVFAAFLYSQNMISKNLEEMETDFAKFGPRARNSVFGQQIADAIEASRATAIGALAPDFTQIDKEGNSISLTDYRGKYLILSFWGSWCGPCRQGHPALIELYNKYKNENFDILGLAGNERDRDRWLAAIETDGLVWKQINMMENDAEQALAKIYNIRGYPSKLLLDPEGKVLAYCLGGWTEIREILSEIFGK